MTEEGYSASCLDAIHFDLSPLRLTPLPSLSLQEAVPTRRCANGSGWGLGLYFTQLRTAIFVISALAFVISALAFVISAIAFVISAIAFAISANSFAISANAFAISANSFAISANAFAI
ncbi:hypothetical protein, partial [uncultured Nostoc sp.]|uniref:hypothetical protein n=1 Tax=uncultured Nostoc sp. TaxID=340711 RepID=UPI0035C9EF12